MAIKVDYIYSTNHSGVMSWLRQNAVPTYFDRVEADASVENKVNCYVGDTIVLSFKHGQYGGTALAVSTSSGLTKEVTVTDMNSYARYGYSSGGGLAVSFGISDSNHLISLIITKDNAGNTTIITGASTNVNVGKNVNAMTSVDLLLDTQEITQRTASTTTLLPFLCGCIEGDSRFTPSAFYMPTVQYNSQGKLYMGGQTFLSNGCWVLKDE